MTIFSRKINISLSFPLVVLLCFWQQSSGGPVMSGLLINLPHPQNLVQLYWSLGFTAGLLGGPKVSVYGG